MQDKYKGNLERMQPILNGYWLPRSILPALLDSSSEYETLYYLDGNPVDAQTPGAITARYPILSYAQWHYLLESLDKNREMMPSGPAIWERLTHAIHSASQELSNPLSPLSNLILSSLPRYTGYSAEMLVYTLQSLNWIDFKQMLLAIEALPSRKSITAWQSIPGIPGRLRFFPDCVVERMLGVIPGIKEFSLHGPVEKRDLLAGYGAGNVPGTALLISLLTLAIGLGSVKPPAAIIKNSRREPIFSPLVLDALERADPDLFASTAVLIWDVEDAKIQEQLFSKSDLVLVAAGDDTIAAVRAQSKRISRLRSRKLHFLDHGHKVSFTAVGKEFLSHHAVNTPNDKSLLQIIAQLAALDSSFWDQHGCLSSRIHFIETGEGTSQPDLTYALHLKDALQRLARVLPRGAWGRGYIHDRFDFYKQLETTGSVQVLSSYTDEFLVVIDRRMHTQNTFARLLNDCQGRIVVIKPVDNLMEVADRYLRLIHPNNLQSLSVALGEPGMGLDQRILRFAAACGNCGVTAIRTVGRAAFPQLAYSWDGWIPLDLLRRRPSGHFTTIEFDEPYGQIMETYSFIQSHGLSD